MRLSSVRDLEGIKPVLLDKNATGPNVVYQIYTNIPESPWINKTVISPGLYGQEFPKTFGHYHRVLVKETYRVSAGSGILVLQKKHFDRKIWVPEMVDEALLIIAKTGDELTIAPEFGHSWSNTGSEELALLDNWSAGHSPEDYYYIEKLQGLAYYLISDHGKPKAVPNPHYRNLPEPWWLTAAEFTNILGNNPS